MKTSLALMVALLGLACASFVTQSSSVKYADKETLQKQEDLLALLRFVHQPDYNQQLVSYKDFSIEENISSYTNVPAIKVNFFLLWQEKFCDMN